MRRSGNGKMRILEDLLRRLGAPADGNEPRREIKRLRDRAIVALMAHGLSSGQVTALDVENVNLAVGLVHARSQRKGFSLIIELDADEADALRKWVATRALLCPPTRALFVRLHWTDAIAAPLERLGERGCRQMIGNYALSLAGDA